MPTFRVTVTKTVQEWYLVEVDADDADQAEAIALRRCNGEDGLCNEAPYDTEVVGKPQVVDMAIITK